jgi:hypothetical protein
MVLIRQKPEMTRREPATGPGITDSGEKYHLNRMPDIVTVS